MTMRESPAIEYAFNTRITPLVTSGTLNTAQRHEFAQITVAIPETTSRTFQSAYLEFTTRDHFTVAANITGLRMGISVGTHTGYDVTKTTVNATTGGAASVGTMAADGYVEFTAHSTEPVSHICGLSTTNASATWDTVHFGIGLFPAGVGAIYESSNTPAFGSPTITYRVGDVFRIQRAGTTIRYYQNGGLLFTSGLTSTGSLLIDTAVNDYGRIADIRFFPAGVETAVTWTNLVNVSAGAASGFRDIDIAITSVNTGDHMADRWTRDVTDAFNEMYTGTSCPVKAALAISTSTDAAMNNLTCKLVLGYSYDDTGQNTFIKTVRIPLQSHWSTLTTSHQEFGTTGGVGSTDAPTNQIPALHHFLPEAGKVYRQAFLQFYSNESTAVNTTDFTPYIQIDATAEVARATLEEALGTNLPWSDIYIYDTTTYSPTAVHKVTARSDLTARMTAFGGVLNVTYEYDKALTVASGVVMCEALVPFTVGDTDRRQSNENGVSVTTTADADWLSAWFDINESSPTLAQSAAMTCVEITSNGLILKMWCGTQAERQWQGYAAGQGQSPTIQRGDINTGKWAVTQGTNNLTLKSYGNLQRGRIYGYALINYTSDVPADGPHVVTMPRSRLVIPTDGTLVGTYDLALEAPTTISGSTYKIAAMYGDMQIRGATLILDGMTVMASTGEFVGGGWTPVADPMDVSSGGSERITRYIPLPMTRAFNNCNHDTGKLNPSTFRKWRSTSNASVEWGMSVWTSYNNIDCTISGNVRGYTSSGAGISVDVFDPNNKYHTTVTTTSGGGYTATVHDNRDGYWTAARQTAALVGRSDNGTPEE